MAVIMCSPTPVGPQALHLSLYFLRGASQLLLPASGPSQNPRYLAAPVTETWSQAGAQRARSAWKSRPIWSGVTTVFGRLSRRPAMRAKKLKASMSHLIVSSSHGAITARSSA